jgi:hypothetical protein
VAQTTGKILLNCGCFDALVKRWDKYIKVGGGYTGNYIFFPSSNIIRVISSYGPFTESLSYMCVFNVYISVSPLKED